MPSSACPATRGQRKKTQRLPLKDFFLYQPPPPEIRDWAELPLDLICYVFHQLGPVELLIGGAAGVCRSWRRAARDEPELWRHLDMRGYTARCRRSHVPIGALVRAAVHHGAGQCESFWSRTGDDDMICLLAEQASSLKSLRLISCYKMSRKVFAAAITKFSMLEELEISKCSGIVDNESLEAIAKSCPRLKHFRYIIKKKHSYLFPGEKKDGEALAISGMHQLRSLELYRNHLTNKGLTMILDNCVHLELLIIRECPNVIMDGALLAKCARVMIVTLRGDEYAYYKPSTNYAYRGWEWYCDWFREQYWDWVWEQCPTCELLWALYHINDYEYSYSGYGDGLFFPEELDDYDDYSRYLNGVYVTDLDDEQESRNVAKSARRYLKTNTEV
ncbi:unnamed protein product [Urochloa humidicola]